jgi:hypothetical protein
MAEPVGFEPKFVSTVSAGESSLKEVYSTADESHSLPQCHVSGKIL